MQGCGGRAPGWLTLQAPLSLPSPPECAPGFFGPGCLQACACPQGVACDPVSGQCGKQCPAGFWGKDCDQGQWPARGAPRVGWGVGHLAPAGSGPQTSASEPGPGHAGVTRHRSAGPRAPVRAAGAGVGLCPGPGAGKRSDPSPGQREHARCAGGSRPGGTWGGSVTGGRKEEGRPPPGSWGCPGPIPGTFRSTRCEHYLHLLAPSGWELSGPLGHWCEQAWGAGWLKLPLALAPPLRGTRRVGATPSLN